MIKVNVPVIVKVKVPVIVKVKKKQVYSCRRKSGYGEPKQTLLLKNLLRKQVYLSYVYIIIVNTIKVI